MVPKIYPSTLNSETKADIKIGNKFPNFSNGITNAYYVWKYCFKERNLDDATWLDKVILPPYDQNAGFTVSLNDLHTQASI